MPAISVPLPAFLAVWAFLAMNIVTPGPNVLNTIALAIGSGRRAGIGSALGVGIGIGLWSLSTALGFAALFTALPQTRLVMTLLACALLVWFATRYLRQARGGWLARRQIGHVRIESRTGLTLRDGFVRSMAVNATNPKALTTWIAVAGMFPLAGAGAADIGLLTLGACILSFSIHAVYALAFSTPLAARAWLRAAPVLNAVVAVIFLVFAARLALHTLG